MQLSPLLFALIVKSWCLSDREFPKFFKTPLTFNPGLNLKAVIANQTQATSFALVGCTCTCIGEIPIKLIQASNDRLLKTFP